MPMNSKAQKSHEQMLTKTIELRDELTENYNALKLAHSNMDDKDVVGMDKKVLSLIMLAYSCAMATITREIIVRHELKMARIRDSN